MLVPLITGIIFGEWNSVLDFAIGASVTVGFGLVMTTVFPQTSDLTTMQGLAVVAIAWLLAMIFSTIPLFLSGHYLSVLDASFDAMSGFTTTGLVLVQDIDHAPNTLNMWRHLMTFIGGQGIAVLALSVLIRVSGAGGAFEVYSGEAREERVLPNVARTARFIWTVTFTYMVIGVITLFAVLLWQGMEPVKGIMHSIWVFMGSWDTAGHAPQSQSIMFYHSFPVELVTLVLMLGGTLSFGIHYALWHKRKREITRNVESVGFIITVALLSSGVMAGLVAAGTYFGLGELFRRGLYQVLSAHTTTGYMTIYPSELATQWAPLALLSLMIAMGIGGIASSTAGGIKVLRVAIAFKAFVLEIKRLILPESAVVKQKFHHFGTRMVNDAVLRNSLLIFTVFLLTFFGGAAMGMLFGIPFSEALFESTSAAANNGLTVGVTSAEMPTLLKLTYIVQMWFGRLEFLTVMAFFALVIATWRGR